MQVFGLPSSTSPWDSQTKSVTGSNNEVFFVNFGFTELDGKPKCVVKVMSAESMKTNKLQCHLETNYPNCANKTIEFFYAN